MKRLGKLEEFFLAGVLIFFGIQGMLSGEVSAFKGRDGLIPSTTFINQFVPWLGLILVLVGVYIILRFLFWKNK